MTQPEQVVAVLSYLPVPFICQNNPLRPDPIPANKASFGLMSLNPYQFVYLPVPMTFSHSCFSRWAGQATKKWMLDRIDLPSFMTGKGTLLGEIDDVSFEVKEQA